MPKINLEYHLQEAMFLENAGFKPEARKHYDLLKDHLPLLDEKGLKRVSQFYDSVKKFDIVFEASKLGIKRMGDLTTLAPLFIISWKKTGQHANELEWLIIQPGMDHLLQEKLAISRLLFIKGKTDKAYMVSLEIAEQIEYGFRENPSWYKLYTDAILNLTEMEFIFKNFTQARFHIRKLIYIKKDFFTRVQDIAYWAILLDEITHYSTRPDWDKIEQQLKGDVLLISRFYHQLSKNKLDKQLMKQFEELTFADEMLEKKRKTYLHFIRKLSGQRDGLHSTKQNRSELPHDLLTSLLYADYKHIGNPGDVKAFWENEFPKHADRPEAIKTYWDAQKNEKHKSPNPDLQDCEITFFGGGQKIGGTSILISVKGHHLLLDAGMHVHQEHYHPDYQPMEDMGIGFQDIDALLLTHAHLDHTGAVPYVHKRQNDLPIYATEPTKSLMKMLLTDSARIAKQEKRDFYSEVDVQNTVLTIKPIDFYRSFVVPSGDEEWKVTYYPSGHILGAGSIYIEMMGIKILFTGDYSIDEQKTVQGLRLPDDLQVDILITESTYGFLPTNASVERKRQEKLFVESVLQTMEKNGTMLIPAFAVGRAQEIILILKDAFKSEKYLPFDLFLDGRVTDVCRIYERFAEKNQFINPAYFQGENGESPFFGGGVQVAQDIYSSHENAEFTFNDFLEDYILPGNNCIVASSGMLTENSASSKYAEALIEDEKNSISFTGFMDEESPGHHVLDTSKMIDGETVTINGSKREVRASIESFRLSAHASREQILQLIAKIQPKKVFLMHGEHNKRYKPVRTIAEGNKIYPSIIDLLVYLKNDLQVIPAVNGQSYHLGERE